MYSRDELLAAEEMSEPELLSDVWNRVLPKRLGATEPSDEVKKSRFLAWLVSLEICEKRELWAQYQKKGDRWQLMALVADMLGASGSATAVVLAARVGLSGLCADTWSIKGWDK